MMQKNRLAPFDVEVLGLDVSALSAVSFDELARVIAGSEVVIIR